MITRKTYNIEPKLIEDLLRATLDCELENFSLSSVNFYKDPYMVGGEQSFQVEFIDNDYYSKQVEKYQINQQPCLPRD